MSAAEARREVRTLINEQRLYAADEGAVKVAKLGAGPRRSAMNYDLDTPEGRYAVSQALGIEGYNAAMREHRKASTVETVNGYNLRWVPSRFGRLCMIDGAGAAFGTIEAARAHAAGLPAGWRS